MSDEELTALVEEAVRQRIGSRWLAEIRSACSDVSRHFDPAIYAVAESAWSPSELDELVQDVTTGQLLDQGQLDYVLDVAESVDDVRRLLRHQVRRTLVGRRRRTVIDRLLARSRDRLAAPAYEEVRGGSPLRYRPVGTTFDQNPPSDQAIRAAAARVRLLPVTASTGDRAPAVFRAEVLAQALDLSFEATGTSLSIDDLGRILREALTSWVPVILGLGDEIDSWPADTVEPFELEEIVSDLIDRLSDTDRLVLRLKLIGQADAAVAAALGVSRPTAAKQKVESFGLLRDLWTEVAGDLSPAQSARVAQELVVRLNAEEAGER